MKINTKNSNLHTKINKKLTNQLAMLHNHVYIVTTNVNIIIISMEIKGNFLHLFAFNWRAQSPSPTRFYNVPRTNSAFAGNAALSIPQNKQFVRKALRKLLRTGARARIYTKPAYFMYNLYKYTKISYRTWRREHTYI